MLDPLTALGAVANVAQFIEFAIKIFSSSQNIYHSASGSLVEHDDLSQVTDDISDLSSKLRDSLSTAAATASLTTDEQALLELCEGCVGVSEDLTKALDKLRGQAKPGKFRSFRQALKSVWSKDDIDQLEKRVRMYKEELNVRIIVGLRTTIDTQALRHSEGFATLGEDVKAVMSVLDSIRIEIQDGLQRQNKTLVVMHAQTDTLIGAHAQQDREEHKILGSRINGLSRQSCGQSAQILDAQANTKLAVDLTAEQNLAEHNKTREEMNCLKEQAERQVEVLTEEIRLLKIELENSVKAIVASINTASKRETERMKEASNAKFNMWVAKELVLEKLKAFIALFRFNFSSEVWTSNTRDFKSWKLTLYPKADRASSTIAMNGHTNARDVEERPMVYHAIDLNYPVAAGNVPLLKMCLEQGADANRTPLNRYTPLMLAIQASYEPRPGMVMDIHIARRDAQKMVQLLLEHGADPDLPDGRVRGWNARMLEEQLSKKKQFGGLHATVEPDWMIKQLPNPDPSSKLQQCLAITDAAWAGELEAMEAILAEQRGLRQLMQSHRISPLTVAVYRGDEGMVSMLLNQGFSSNALDVVGSPPLGIAMTGTSQTIIELLVWGGADLSIIGPVFHQTPLTYAVEKGAPLLRRKFIEDVIDEGPTDQTTLSRLLALTVAALHQPEEVKLLLDSGANISLNMHDFMKLSKIDLKHEHLTPLAYVERCIRRSFPINESAGIWVTEEVLVAYEEKMRLRVHESNAAPCTGFADMIEIMADFDNDIDDVDGKPVTDQLQYNRC